jgi:hypothetical protein
MNRRFLLFGLAVVLALFLVPGAVANPAPTQLAKYDLTFLSATDTFTFEVAKGEDNPAGDLTADTVDCCIPGDLWQVSFATALPANPANDVTGIGNGSTTEYSGAATSHPFVSGSVTVSYSSGTDVFPAEMCVRFQYSKAPGVEITPPAGAVENGPACI